MFLAPPDWTTIAERTGFTQTGRYEEALAFCRRLDEASEQAKLIRIGKSPEGRDMVALILSKEGRFDVDSLRSSSKPLVLVENGIHSGEIEGKDACLMLARDIVITRERASLIDRVNVMIVPVFSVDAHERFGPFNRINQNGPKEMGWRATANNLNLNRDFMKADAGEMRNMLRLVHTYRPDLFIDSHTTDGSDHQYVAMLDIPRGPHLPSTVDRWNAGWVDFLYREVEADGFLTSPYFGMIDSTDPSKGLTVDTFGPRYSHGYFGAALGRPSLLIETHVLKPYKQRVFATYSVIRRTLEYAADQSGSLKGLVQDLDRSRPKPGSPIVVSSRLTDAKDPFSFKGWEYAGFKSDISGGTVRNWKHTPTVTETTIRQSFGPGTSVNVPVGYLVPSPWAEAIDRLQLHGVKIQRLAAPYTAALDTYSFSGVSFARAPFEGRMMPNFTSKLVTEPRIIPAGSAFVSMDQLNWRLAVHLLEPDAPDSLIRWGFFNAIFEQKEYGEDYAVEPVARKMLEADPKLRAEFEERLKDAAFANSPGARLDFFFQKSPWADRAWNRYPVVRLSADQIRSLKLVPESEG